MLLLFVVPSLLIGVSARSHLVNINSLFDRRLRETDHLMVSEPVAIEDDRFRLATVVKAIRAPQEYREIVERRSASFEKAYPKLVRRGVIALFAVPLCLFALALALDAKLPIVGCLVVFLVCVYVFLIVVEYFHDRIARKKALTNLSPGELDDVLADTLRDELMPYASIDALLEMRGARQEKKHHGKLLQHIEERSNLRHKTEADAEVSEGGDEQ
jgi:putative membrane protein